MRPSDYNLGTLWNYALGKHMISRCQHQSPWWFLFLTTWYNMGIFTFVSTNPSDHRIYEFLRWKASLGLCEPTKVVILHCKDRLAFPVLSLLFDLQCKRVVTIILASFFVLRKCWEDKYHQVHNYAGNVVFCSVSDSYKCEQSKLECIIIVPIIRWTNSYFAS